MNINERIQSIVSMKLEIETEEHKYTMMISNIGTVY